MVSLSPSAFISLSPNCCVREYASKMAAPTEDWRDKLKVHPICKRLKDVASKRHPSETNGEAKSLLAIKNGDLFVWDSFSANVVHCNLKCLLPVSQPQANDTGFHFQVLLLMFFH